MIHKYKQQNINFDKISNINILKKRIKRMPIMLDAIIAGLYSYIDGNLNLKDFITSHTDKSVPFYKRIELGDAAKEYQENYKPEISLVKTVSEACATHIQNKLTDEQFDSILENAIENYNNIEIKREKDFVI